METKVGRKRKIREQINEIKNGQIIEKNQWHQKLVIWKYKNR